MYQLSDIYIGNFPITQNFGARPDIYNARYGLKGHNGIDIGCPSLTLILSAADGFVSEIGSRELGTYDTAGYGNYIKIVHDGFFTLYGHLNDISVKKGDKVIAGQLIGHSNNTGFSDGPHLHFGVAPCDASGNKTEKGNGYSGYVDPLNTQICQWNIKNLAKPIDPTSQQEDTKISIPSSDFTRMVSEGSNYRVIASDLVQNGINQFLSDQGLSQIDVTSKTADPMAGENIVKYIKYQRAEIQELNKKLEQAQKVPEHTKTDSESSTTTRKIEIEKSDEALQQEAKKIIATATPLTNLLKKLYSKVTAFIFVQS